MNKQTKNSWVPPQHLKDVLETSSTVISFKELNSLINCVEHLPFIEKSFQNHPIVFKILSEDSSPIICKVGYTKQSHIVFYVGHRKVFSIEEEYWCNINFDELQEMLFDSGEDKYQLLEGTFSRKFLK